MGKDGKSAEQLKLGIQDHFRSFQTTLVGKIEENNGQTKIGHSESFWTSLVGKDGEKYEMIKTGHSKSFWTTLVEKD